MKNKNKIDKENLKDYKNQMKIYNKIKKIFFKYIKYEDFIYYENRQKNYMNMLIKNLMKLEKI